MSASPDRRSEPWLPAKKRAGWQRLLASLRYSGAGFRYGLQHEAAIREVFTAVLVLGGLSFFIPVAPVEHLILALSLLLVLVAEFINSAIETVVDRVSLERHELAGRAKDLGSAAVALTAMAAGLCWLVILAPVVRRWLWP